MRLGKKTLDGVDQVANAGGALAPLLGSYTSCTLVLQSVKTIRVEGHLLLKLVHQIWGNAMHLSSVT